MASRTETFLNLYHGTDTQSAEKILNEGFQPSKSENSWCGSGIYFYDVISKAWWWADRTCGSIKSATGRKVEPEVLKADILNLEKKSILDLRASGDVKDFKATVDDLTRDIKYETDELDDEERVIFLRRVLIEYYAQKKNKKLIVGIFKQRDREDMAGIIEYGKALHFVLGVETIYCVRDRSIISNIRRSTET